MVTLARACPCLSNSGSRPITVGVARRPPVPRRAVAAGAASPLALSSAAEAVLLDVERLELETAARRAAYAAQREAEIAAQRSGLPWWEVDCPPNMGSVSSLAQLQAAVEGAAAAGQLAVVHFFAPECYACKSLQPKLRQIARDNPGVVFTKVNGLVGDLQAYCEDMGITRIPYFHLYRGNKRVAEFSANMRPEKLAMLRAEIASQAKAAAAEAAAAGAGALQQA